MGYRKDAERFKGATGGICMTLLLQTEDSLACGGVVLRIRHVGPPDCLEDACACIPQSDRCRPSSSLIPGPIDQGFLRNNPLMAPPMPPQEDILTRSDRFGGATGFASPATCRNRTDSSFHQLIMIRRAFVCKWDELTRRRSPAAPCRTPLPSADSSSPPSLSLSAS
jgi:hypothetical protein